MGIGWVWKAAEGVARSFQSSSWNSKFEQSEVSNSNVLLFNSKWPSSYVQAGEAVVRSRLDFVPATASRRLLRDQGREGRGTGRRLGVVWMRARILTLEENLSRMKE